MYGPRRSATACGCAYMWLIDPDRPPVLPRVLRPLAGFDARDHFGGTSPTIRAGLDRYLASHGVELGGGRVVMLAHARVLGHVFNPLTLYWCHGPGGEPLCVVAEVHNTYGERHCYLLRPGDRAAGADENTFWVDKELYVSPFFPVDGGYRMRLPEPAARLELTVHLERDGGRPFTATVRGERRAATPGRCCGPRCATRCRPPSSPQASATTASVSTCAGFPCGRVPDTAPRRV